MAKPTIQQLPIDCSPRLVIIDRAIYKDFVLVYYLVSLPEVYLLYVNLIFLDLEFLIHIRSVVCYIFEYSMLNHQNSFSVYVLCNFDLKIFATL